MDSLSRSFVLGSEDGMWLQRGHTTVPGGGDLAWFKDGVSQGQSHHKAVPIHAGLEGQDTARQGPGIVQETGMDPAWAGGGGQLSLGDTGNSCQDLLLHQWLHKGQHWPKQCPAPRLGLPQLQWSWLLLHQG